MKEKETKIKLEYEELKKLVKNIKEFIESDSQFNYIKKINYISEPTKNNIIVDLAYDIYHVRIILSLTNFKLLLFDTHFLYPDKSINIIYNSKDINKLTNFIINNIDKFILKEDTKNDI